MLRYRLDELGWYQFEGLCQSLLKHTVGLTVESWGGRGDHGVDAYCPGPLQLVPSQAPDPGPFIFQVKFVENANAAGAKPAPGLETAARAETAIIQKASKRSWKETARRYVLLTNAPITADQRNTLRGVIRQAIPDAEVTIWGGSDVCDMLDGQPSLRAAWPQLLGLSDFQHIFTSVVAKPILERSQAAIEAASELAPVFVPTRAYSKAVRVAERHSFVVLTGPPEMGKTAVARMLAFLKLSEGWQALECHEPSELFQLFDKEARQVFVADDAFGSTEFDPVRADRWGRDLEPVLRRLDRYHWLLWTSRPAPLHQALASMHLQGPAEGFPNPGEVLVDASELTPQEKALILYRHAKSAGLSATGKQLVRSGAMKIIQHPHFTPERIRRLVRHRLKELNERAPTGTLPSVEELLNEIREPTRAMSRSFAALPSSYRAVLYALLDAGAGQVSLARLKEIISHFCPEEKIPPGELISHLSQHFLRLERVRF